MKLEKKGSFKNFEGQENISMGLDLDDPYSIMSLLRNNIYSDPINSLVREIYSNAVDAHLKSNNTIDPIEVSFIETDTSNYEFSVRDYGNSMDKEKVKSVYALLGKSDKSNSNIEIGGFGLGSASPLAYTDNFFIETWTIENSSQVYRKWVQYIDASRVGALTLLEEDVLNNVNNFRSGTKISIPIEKKDFEKTKRAIELYLHYTKFKYVFKGVFTLSKNKVKYNLIGNGWALRSRSNYVDNNWIILVKDIPYVFNKDKLYDHKTLTEEGFKKLGANKNSCVKNFYLFLENCKYVRLELNCDIGEIDLSASREELQYTDKTLLVILRKLIAMYQDFLVIAEMNLKKNPSFIDACFNYNITYRGVFIGSQGILKDYKWEKEAKTFNIFQSIFKHQNDDATVATLIGLRDKTFKKTKQYSLDVIRNKNYIVVCKEEEPTRKLSKFLKFYMLKQNYNSTVKFILVPQHKVVDLNSWIKDDIPFITEEFLEEFYNNNYVRVRKLSTNKLPKSKTNGFVFANKIYREKAKGMGTWFKDALVTKFPSVKQYYITHEDYENLLKEGFKILDDGEGVKFFGYWLTSKSIDHELVYYSKKYHSYYNHDNWISLADSIRESEKEFSSKKKDFMIQYFTKVVATVNYPFLVEERLNKEVKSNGTFKYLHNLLNNIHIDIQQELYNFMMLTCPTARFLNSKLALSFTIISMNSKTNWVDEIYREEFIKIFQEFESFLNIHPFLKSYRRLEMSFKEIGLYITLMENYLNKEASGKHPEASFKNLYNYFNN